MSETVFERFRFRGTFVPRSELMTAEDADGYVVLKVDEHYRKRMRDYYWVNVAEQDNKEQMFTCQNVSDDWTEEAKGFMFAVRDRICKKLNSETRQYKDHLYLTAKKHCGFTWPSGEVKSLYDLTQDEVWTLTNTLLDMAVSAEAVVEDMMSDHQRLAKEHSRQSS